MPNFLADHHWSQLGQHFLLSGKDFAALLWFEHVVGPGDELT